MSKEFILKYVNQKKQLKQYYEREKTGDQTLYTDQAKLLEPLINSQKETSRTIQDKIVTGQESLSNALVPLVQELQKRNDQVEALQSLPFYNIPEIEGVAQSTPKSKDIMIDLNGELVNQTHLENLVEMQFELPSVVQEKGTLQKTLESIMKKKNSLVQLTGKTGSKRSDGEKEVFKSQKATLEIYERKIKTLQKNYSEFDIKLGKGLCKHKLVKQKRGRGRPKLKPDLIVYSRPGDLVYKLGEYIIAKEAGNTSLDNYITEILDELLEKKCISKEDYDNTYKRYFPQ